MDERIWTLLKTSFTQILIPGFQITLPLTAVSFVLGLLIALITALVQVAKIPVLRQFARTYVWIFRGTPMLVQLFVVFYGLPKVGVYLDAIPAAIVVFSLNTGAYASETIRASILSVPVGQMEAGYCVGMTYTQTMFRIILPQALRTAFPPLSNTLIGLVKDTSLASNITVTEMFLVSQRIAARTYEPFWLYIEVGAVYLIFCTVLTWLQGWLEKRLERK